MESLGSASFAMLVISSIIRRASDSVTELSSPLDVIVLLTICSSCLQLSVGDYVVVSMLRFLSPKKGTEAKRSEWCEGIP